MSSIYEAPTAELEAKGQAEYKLYKVSGVWTATFLGSMLAGGIVMAINYKRLGMDAEANKTLLYSVLAMLAFFVIIYFIPDDINIPQYVFVIPQVVVMAQLAKRYQQEYIDVHIQNGGEMASNWKAAGIAILTVIPLVAFFVAAVMLFS